MRAMFILPFANGRPQFPGLAEDAQVGFCTISYSPPPLDTPQYVLVEIETEQANIDILAARADCLLMCNVIIDEDGKQYDTDPITPTDRVAIRNKIAAMGWTGEQLGLINAAIQASQNSAELVYKLGTKAFIRNVNKDLLIDADITGQG